MRTVTLLALTLTLMLSATGWSTPPATVTYIANEGFLVEAGGKKILIDAIFDDRTITYAHIPSETTLKQLQTGEAPFDGVTAMFVTHAHRDHFSAAPVFQRLLNDPAITLIGPPQMLEQIKQNQKIPAAIAERIHTIDISMHASTDLDINGIAVRATRLRHSPYMVTDEKTGKEYNRHEHVENLIYRIDLGTVSVLHVGDATLSGNPEIFEREDFSKDKVDIVFLEYFDWSKETKAILETWFKPETLVFMHLPPEREKIDQLELYLKNLFPEAELFKEPLERRQF